MRVLAGLSLDLKFSPSFGTILYSGNKNGSRKGVSISGPWLNGF